MLPRLLGRRKSPSRSPKSFRPSLEELGQRIAPANLTCTWSGNGLTNNASEAANWAGNVRPVDATDTALFTGDTGQWPNANKSVVFDGFFTGDLLSVQVRAPYAGTLELARILTAHADFSQAASTLTIDAGQTLTAHYFNFAGGSVAGSAGRLSVTGTPADQGAVNFLAASTNTLGTLVTDANSQMAVSANTTFDGTRVTNGGLGRWMDGNIVLLNNAGFTNTGTFTALSDRTMRSVLAGPFLNFGVFVKDQSFGDTEIRTQFNNQGAGLVWVRSGTVSGTRGGNDSAPFTIDPGATLEFSAGITTLGPGTSFGGGGITRVAGTATLSVPPNVAVDFGSVLEMMDNSTLDGAGAISSGNNFHWAGGTVSNLAGLYVFNGMLIDGPAVKSLSNTTLNSTAQAVWDGTGNIELTSSTFNNYGYLEIRNNQIFRDTIPAGGSTFNNGAVPGGRGSVAKTGGVNGTVFDIQFETSADLSFGGYPIRFQRGIIQSDPNSSTVLAGGTLAVDAGQVYSLQGGTLIGGGFISGSLNVSGGTVDVGSAPADLPLTVSGNYTQQGGTLKVHASGDSAWGWVNVWGNADLAGTLVIDLLMPYAPASGFQQTILTVGGTRTGTFPDPAGWTVTASVSGITVTKQ
jgi:hypothetical protein